MKRYVSFFISVLLCSIPVSSFSVEQEIVHDAEYYILEAQHAEKWAADDKIVDEKLAAFREKTEENLRILYIF